METPLLQLRSVAKAFGARVLFRGVNADFPPCSLSVLAGANGSGKSTLLKIAAGLSAPDTGSVTRNAARGKIGYMAHATFLYPALEARKNLLFWARAASLPDPGKKADEVLKITGLSASAHEKAGIFSRGMAQRLNLARLLLNDPDLILLDEPSTGLDTNSRAMLRDIMLAARARGAAILWISHDLEEDARHADRVLVLRDRTLAQEAPC